MDREQQLKEIAYELHRELGRSATMAEINDRIHALTHIPRHAREEEDLEDGCDSSEN